MSATSNQLTRHLSANDQHANEIQPNEEESSRCGKCWQRMRKNCPPECSGECWSNAMRRLCIRDLLVFFCLGLFGFAILYAVVSGCDEVKKCNVDNIISVKKVGDFMADLATLCVFAALVETWQQLVQHRREVTEDRAAILDDHDRHEGAEEAEENKWCARRGCIQSILKFLEEKSDACGINTKCRICFFAVVGLIVAAFSVTSLWFMNCEGSKPDKHCGSIRAARSGIIACLTALDLICLALMFFEGLDFAAAFAKVNSMKKKAEENLDNYKIKFNKKPHVDRLVSMSQNNESYSDSNDMTDRIETYYGDLGDLGDLNAVWNSGDESAGSFTNLQFMQ